MSVMTKTMVRLGAGALLLAATYGVQAAGGDDDDKPVPVCAKGEVYSQKAKACVKQHSSNLTEEDRTEYAYALAKSDRYQEALDVLDTLQDRNTSVALNYRGYATRKLGRTDEGIGYYLQSVAMAPHYAKVREYLGEAYVIKGRSDLAEDQLTTIKAICGTECEEYRDLREAIERPASL